MEVGACPTCGAGTLKVFDFSLETCRRKRSRADRRSVAATVSATDTRHCHSGRSSSVMESTERNKHPQMKTTNTYNPVTLNNASNYRANGLLSPYNG